MSNPYNPHGVACAFCGAEPEHAWSLTLKGRGGKVDGVMQCYDWIACDSRQVAVHGLCSHPGCSRPGPYPFNTEPWCREHSPCGFVRGPAADSQPKSDGG